ncbi:MAG: protein-glutamine glutaminase family protein [Ginsengibacter sp.]
MATSIIDTGLTDCTTGVITLDLAQSLFEYFKDSALFRWKDGNNDCEDRANAICILLDTWHVPNYKGWVFSGYFLKKNLGSLINSWNYHVAALLPVQDHDLTEYYVIDPSTSPCLETLTNWAVKITFSEISYHCIKDGDVYIFPPGKIKKDNWFTRNKGNSNWTIQGLSGINGLSSKGKAQLAFNKKRVMKTLRTFNTMKNERPLFLTGQMDEEN